MYDLVYKIVVIYFTIGLFILMMFLFTYDKKTLREKLENLAKETGTEKFGLVWPVASLLIICLFAWPHTVLLGIKNGIKEIKKGKF